MTKWLLAHALMVPFTGFAVLGMDAVFTSHDISYIKSPFTVAAAMFVGLFALIGAALMIRQTSVKVKDEGMV